MVEWVIPRASDNTHSYRTNVWHNAASATLISIHWLQKFHALPSIDCFSVYYTSAEKYGQNRHDADDAVMVKQREHLLALHYDTQVLSVSMESITCIQEILQLGDWYAHERTWPILSLSRSQQCYNMPHTKASLKAVDATIWYWKMGHALLIDDNTVIIILHTLGKTWILAAESLMGFSLQYGRLEN